MVSVIAEVGLQGPWVTPAWSAWGKFARVFQCQIPVPFISVGVKAAEGRPTNDWSSPFGNSTSMS